MECPGSIARPRVRLIEEKRGMAGNSDDRAYAREGQCTRSVSSGWQDNRLPGGGQLIDGLLQRFGLVGLAAGVNAEIRDAARGDRRRSRISRARKAAARQGTARQQKMTPIHTHRLAPSKLSRS